MSEELPDLPTETLHAWAGKSIAVFTAEQMREYARQAVLMERERCAKVAEAQANEYGGQDYYAIGCVECAAAIRGNK